MLFNALILLHVICMILALQYVCFWPMSFLTFCYLCLHKICAKLFCAWNSRKLHASKISRSASYVKSSNPFQNESNWLINYCSFFVSFKLLTIDQVLRHFELLLRLHYMSCSTIYMIVKLAIVVVQCTMVIFKLFTDFCTKIVVCLVKDL